MMKIEYILESEWIFYVLLIFTFQDGYVEGIDQVYFGNTNRTMYMISNQEYPYDEGVIDTVCDGVGGDVVADLGDVELKFIKHTLITGSGATLPEYIWLNYIKSSSGIWHNTAKSCEQETLSDVVGVHSDTVQCLALNMSGVSYDAEIVALPCSERHSFICKERIETLDIEEYIDMNITSTLKESFKNATYTDISICMHEIKTDRKLVAVEYVTFPNGTGKCTVYRTKIQAFPITLTFGTVSGTSVYFVSYTGVGDDVSWEPLIAMENGTLPCISNTLNENITVAVYPSRYHTVDIFVFFDKRTWFEAAESCKQKGYLLYAGWRTDHYYNYIVGNSIRNSNTSIDGLWVGYFLNDNTGLWTYVHDCDTLNTGPHVINNSTGNVTCWMLNATAPYGQNVYAESCLMELPYVCREYQSVYYNTTDRYHVYNSTRILNGVLSLYDTLSNMTISECVNELFSEPCTAAEYQWGDIGYCKLFAYPSQDLPVNITLVNAHDNMTTITVSQTDITFAYDSSIITAVNEFPSCEITTAISSFGTTQDTNNTSTLSINTINSSDVVNSSTSDTIVSTDASTLDEGSTLDFTTSESSTLDYSTVGNTETFEGSTSGFTTLDFSTLDYSTLDNTETIEGSTSDFTTLDVSTSDYSTVDNTETMEGSTSDFTTLAVSTLGYSTVDNTETFEGSTSDFTTLDVSTSDYSTVDNTETIEGSTSDFTTLDVSTLGYSTVDNTETFEGSTSDFTTLDVSTLDYSTLDNTETIEGSTSDFTTLDVSTSEYSTVDNTETIEGSTSDFTTLDASTLDYSTVENTESIEGSTSDFTTLDFSTLDYSTVENTETIEGSTSDFTTLNVSTLRYSTPDNIETIEGSASDFTTFKVSTLDYSTVDDKTQIIEGSTSDLSTVDYTKTVEGSTSDITTFDTKTTRYTSLDTFDVSTLDYSTVDNTETVEGSTSDSTTIDNTKTVDASTLMFSSISTADTTKNDFTETVDPSTFDPASADYTGSAAVSTLEYTTIDSNETSNDSSTVENTETVHSPNSTIVSVINTTASPDIINFTDYLSTLNYTTITSAETHTSSSIETVGITGNFSKASAIPTVITSDTISNTAESISNNTTLSQMVLSTENGSPSTENITTDPSSTIGVTSHGASQVSTTDELTSAPFTSPSFSSYSTKYVSTTGGTSPGSAQVSTSDIPSVAHTFPTNTNHTTADPSTSPGSTLISFTNETTSATDITTPHTSLTTTTGNSFLETSEVSTAHEATSASSTFAPDTSYTSTDSSTTVTQVTAENVSNSAITSSWESSTPESSPIGTTDSHTTDYKTTQSQSSLTTTGVNDFTFSATSDVTTITYSNSHGTVRRTLTTKDYSSSTDVETTSPNFVSTTTSSVPYVSSNQSCCACAKQNKTSEEIQQEIEEMRRELTVDTKTLSSYTRKKTSAPDERPSSATIGSVAIIIMTFVFSLFVVADLPYILIFISNAKVVAMATFNFLKAKFSKTPSVYHENGSNC